MSDVNFFDEPRNVPLSDDTDGFMAGDRKLTFLTGSILLLVMLMLLMIGEQAVKTERIFFRKVAFRTNQKIADLISQQFGQVFSNATALVEDMAQFPTVSKYDSDLCAHLFQLILKRHTLFRSFHILKIDDIKAGRNIPFESPKGRQWRWFNTNVNSFRPLSEKDIMQLTSKYEPSRLTDYYTTSDGEPAITFACAIRDKASDDITGIIVAELDLQFLQPVIDGAELGRTGDVLVADKAGKVIFSTRGFADLEDFNNKFPVGDAYKNNKGAVEYFGERSKLAAYTRVRSIVGKAFLPTMTILPFPTTISQREIPDWLIVVVQDSAEGYLVADRMKWNIAILLIIGAVGVLIVGKLWLDSIR